MPLECVAYYGGRWAGTWGPLLVGVYGLGLTGAGFFIADPALGFPPGTPAEAHGMSWHGTMHFVSGGVGFFAVIAACFVFARRFVHLGPRGWAAFSVATGLIFFATFYEIASGPQRDAATVAPVNIAFSVAVVLVCIWISAVSATLVNKGQ